MASVTIGEQLRSWRRQRRLSQLDLALEADISPRHLSFVETGRAQPSRAMLLHLCEQLRVPLRERNQLLLAAGFAPVFPERSLADPALAAARETIELVLGRHEPYPALAVDRHWQLVSANQAVTRLLHGVDPALVRRRSMRCGSACTRRDWRRASATWRRGGAISWRACSSKSTFAPIRR